MANIMNNGLIVTVNLQGVIGGCVSNTSSKEVLEKVISSPFERSIMLKGEHGKNKFQYITPEHHFKADETFVQREQKECTKKTHITEEVVKNWISSQCPFWEREFVWKFMNASQRIKSYINRFDEGYGVSFETL